MIKTKNSLIFIIILCGNIAYSDTRQTALFPSDIDIELYDFAQNKINQDIDFTEEDLSTISNSVYAEYLYIEHALVSYPNKIFAPLVKSSRLKLVNSMNQLYIYLIQNNSDKIELLWNEFGVYSYYAYLIASQGEKNSNFESLMIADGYHLKSFYYKSQLYKYFVHKARIKEFNTIESKIDYILSKKCVLGYVPLSSILTNSDYDEYLFDKYNNLYPSADLKIKRINVKLLRYRILNYFIRNKKIDYLSQINFDLAKIGADNYPIGDFKLISEEIVSNTKDHNDLWYYTTNAHLFFNWTSPQGYR